MVSKAVAGSVCVFLCAFIAFGEVFAAPDDIATIASFEGNVLVQFPGEKWIPAQRVMPVHADVSIKTGSDSYCDIALDGSFENIVSIGPETSITLGAHLQSLRIRKGRVFTILTRLAPGSSFEVRTPIASGGARGTAWETVFQKGAMFNVTEDTITVTGFDAVGKKTETKPVGPAMTVAVDRHGRVGDIQALSEGDAARLHAWRQRIEKNIQQSSGRGDWRDVVDDYDGQTSDLFSDILEQEVGKAGLVPPKTKATDTPLFDGVYEPGSGIPGSDITTQTFGADSPGDGQGGYSGGDEGYP